jgi:phenylalanyl-tRNA synthetase beta chain
MKISYNWLKSYIKDIPNADEIANLVTFKVCEVEDVEKLENGDTVFDFKILPDRAHDLLSHQGVAKEISSLLGTKFELPEYKTPTPTLTDLKINIETEGCHRYMGRIVRGVKIGPTPKWMAEYLASIGQRSINNIVDATNIVMFDCGQPIHAFDLKQVSNQKIVIKQAQNDEKIELVGSEKLTASLKEKDIVITDGIANLAIAGIKGGLNSGVNNDTVDLLIEVANFDSTSVRKTSRRLGIQTEASKRYENNLSPSLCDLAMKEISALIFEMCPSASFEEIVDIYPHKQETKKVNFNASYVSSMLGVIIKDEEIENILRNYNYDFTHTDDGFEVIVPDMRLDLAGPRDFVEEIGRVYGYDKIIPEIPKIEKMGEDNILWQKISFTKQKLIKDGYKEVMTYVFRDKGDLEVLASASDKNFLRTNISDGLKESLDLNQKNLPLLGIDELKIFEVGTVFLKNKEEVHVAYGDKKNIIETTLDKFIEKNKQEFNFGTINLISEENSSALVFKPWSVYPFITRDIAVWVPERISPETLVKIYKDFGTELLICEPKLFDLFTKDGQTSYAYRLVFQSQEKTLTDDEINKIMSKITEKITSSGWKVR